MDALHVEGRLFLEDRLEIVRTQQAPAPVDQLILLGRLQLPGYPLRQRTKLLVEIAD